MIASGFYEWKAEGKKKQPFFIHRTDRKPFAFARLWGTWTSRETGEVVDSCSIITRTPSAQMAALHDRMPVILAPSEYATWLAGPDVTSLLEATPRS